MGIKFKQIDNLQPTFDQLSGDLQGQVTNLNNDVTGLSSGNFNFSGWKYFNGNVDFSGAQGILVDPSNIYTPNAVFADSIKIGYPISTPRNSTQGPNGALQVSGGQINLEDQVNVKNNSNLIVENGTISGGTGDFNVVTGSIGSFSTSLTISGVPVSTGGSAGSINATSGVANIGNTLITSGTGNFDSIDFDSTISTPAHQEGRLFYDSINKALAVYNDEVGITLQIGQEQYIRVRNNIGSTINNGQTVRINGSHGDQAPTVVLASADSEENSQSIGLATHNISNNSFGYVTTHGSVGDLNTLNFSAGDEVFLAIESGALTGVKPVSPNYQMPIGHVIRSHGSQGIVLVEPGNSKLGGGDVKNIGSVSVSGVTFYSESADDAGILGSSNDFVYNSGDKRLGIGTSSPQGILDISTTSSAPIMPRMTDSQMNAISGPVNGMIVYNSTSGGFFGYCGGDWVIFATGGSAGGGGGGGGGSYFALACDDLADYVCGDGGSYDGYQVYYDGSNYGSLSAGNVYVGSYSNGGGGICTIDIYSDACPSDGGVTYETIYDVSYVSGINS